MPDELDLKALRERYEFTRPYLNEGDRLFILKQIERVEGCECRGTGKLNRPVMDLEGHRIGNADRPCFLCHELRADLLELQRRVLER